MLRLLAPLFGFAIFGALFAGIYYEPELIEREIGPPKFRLAPQEAKPDFIEPAALGENISVNITVLAGGPVDIYLLDMENLTEYVLNGTLYGFELPTNATFYNTTFSRSHVATGHDFTFVADGENRWALVFVSAIPLPADWENLTEEEREPYITELGVSMRYLDSEKKSLLLGYLLAIPSVFLVLFTLYAKTRRRGGATPAYRYPHDKGL